jgi:hypothetical protein
MKQFFAMMWTAFPDLRMAVDDLITEGDKVVARTTMSGTHKGEFMGMDPSGKQFRASAIDAIRFADGKAVEHWGVTDAAGDDGAARRHPRQPAASAYGRAQRDAGLFLVRSRRANRQVLRVEADEDDAYNEHR